MLIDYEHAAAASDPRKLQRATSVCNIIKRMKYSSICLLLIVTLFAIPFPEAVAQSGEIWIPGSFNTGSCRLSHAEGTTAGELLEDIALKMKECPDCRAQIIGYSTPDERAHFRSGATTRGGIAEARAQAVKNYFVLGGIDPARITTSGENSTDPDEQRQVTVTLSGWHGR